MITHKSFIAAVLSCLWLGLPAAVPAQAAEPTITLDQAVLKVQQQTGGQVLSAEPHRVGRGLKYFIKVLTPDGHVKKLVVSSEAGKNPASSQSTKNPPAKHAGSKERH